MNELRVEESRVETPDGSMYVRRWCPPISGRTPIILLHDSLGCVDLWRDFPARLAETLQRPVAAYDRLGYGRSDARSAPPSTGFIEEEATRYLPRVVEHVGCDHYLLFGHSVGGGMALTSAALRPEGCLAVISESAQAFVEPRTLEGIREASRQFEQPNQLERLARWHGDKARWVLDAWVDRWLSPAFADWHLEPILDRVTCPVLALHGDQDEFGSSAFPRLIAERCAGPSEYHVLDQCGHVPHRERPEEILHRVADFLQRMRLDEGD